MYVESARGQEYISGWARRERERQREKNIGRGVERDGREGESEGREDWLYGKREREMERERA